MKSELSLGVLFTGKLAPSFETAIHKIRDSLGKLESATKKVTETQNKQTEGTLRLQKGLQGYIKNVEYLLQIQARWYGAKFLLFALADLPVQITKSIIKYAGEIDTARAEMLRWAATSGSVSKQVIQDTEDILKVARKMTTEYPIAFEEMSKTIQAFIGAGISYSVVKEMIPDLAKLRTAFKEIEMEQFAVALTGFFKTFQASIVEGATEAEKFKKILDSILAAQAEGIIRPEQFTKVIQYLGNVSHLAGLSVDQMLALSVAITDTGIMASSAARTLASAMAGISSPKAREVLRKGFGIELKGNIELGSQFLEVIEKIKKKIGEGPVALDWFTQLNELLSKEQSRALMALIEKFDTYYNVLKKLEGAKGGLDLAADLMRMPFPKQWEIFVNILKEIGQFGTDNRSLFKDIVGFLVDFSKGILVAIDRTGTFTGEFDKLGVAGKDAYIMIKILTAAITPWIKLMSTLYSSIKPLIEYINVAARWWDELIGLTNRATVSLENYKKVVATFTLDKAKSEVSSLNAELKELVKTQQKLNEEWSLKTFLGVMLDAMTHGLFKSAPREIQEQINRYIDMLKIAQKKVRDLTEPEKKKEKRKGEEPPPIDVKTYGQSIIASERTIANARLGILISGNNLLLKQLDNYHKLGLIKDEYYYELKNKILDESLKEERKEIEDDWKIREKLHDAEIAKETDEEKQKKLVEAKKADEARKDLRLAEIVNKRLGELDDARTEKRLRNIELEKTAIEHLYKIEEIQREDDLNRAKFSIETKQSLNEWLFSQNLINADKYYAENKRLIEEDYQTNKANLEREFEEHVEYNKNKQYEARNNLVELDRLRKELLEKEKQLANNLVKIEEDRFTKLEELRRKEYDDWDRLYSKEGFLGVVQRYSEKMYNEFFKVGSRIKDIFDGLFGGVKDTLSDFFYDAWTFQLKSAEDYFISFTQSVFRAWSDLMAQMIAKWLRQQAITGAASFFGAGAGGKAGKPITPTEGQIVAHKGGIIGKDYFPKRIMPISLFDYAPRLHKGLNYDEFPAILQKDEVVIPKKDRGRKTIVEPKYDINLNISTIDAQSFQAYLHKNRDALARTIIGMKDDNHPIRRM